MAQTDEDKDNPPMPAATWKPQIEKTPLDPSEDEGKFNENKQDPTDKTDPRNGFTPKPE